MQFELSDNVDQITYDFLERTQDRACAYLDLTLTLTLNITLTLPRIGSVTL